ncbi:MAG: alpha/beta hydrolase [Hyphomonadaceae bacterium]
MMVIDGPRMPPAGGAKPQMLAVLLHGYGSNGADLIALAPFWAKLLPQAQFVAPNGPEPAPGAPGGFQWFALSRPDPMAMEQGARQAAGTLDRFLDRELDRYGLPGDRLALIGFSQGTMMALHVGLRRKPPPAGILGYSGALVSARTLAEEKTGAPPILLIHGDKDDMIPLPAMFDSAESLAKAGLGAQWHVSYGIPHSIGQDGIELGGAFLKMAFAARPALATR